MEENIKTEPKEIAYKSVIFFPVWNINTVDPLESVVADHTAESIIFWFSWGEETCRLHLPTLFPLVATLTQHL
jgi:hypothetical protein